MTNILRQNCSKCIEWTVQISLYDSIESEVFSFQAHKCHLALCLDHDRTVGSYLKLSLKSREKLKSPVKVMVRIAIAPDTLICKGVIAEEVLLVTFNQVIWSRSNIPLKAYTLTVEIISVDSTKDDKSVQTPSYIDKCILMDAISKDYSKLLEEDPNLDIEFICGDQTLKAHKSILSCRSSVFASMFQTDMVEGKTGRVNIVDMDVAIFQQFLKFLYTGILPELMIPEALQFYSAGDKYNISVLKKQCAEFLVDNLSPENACNILIVADRHNDADFKKSIIEYMMEEKIPYMGEMWADFCKEHPMLAIEVLNLFCQHLRPK